MFSDPIQSPPEIVSLILNKLPIKSLYKSLTVSRAWSVSVLHLSSFLKRPDITPFDGNKDVNETTWFFNYLSGYSDAFPDDLTKRLESITCMDGGSISALAERGFQARHLTLQLIPTTVSDSEAVLLSNLKCLTLSSPNFTSDGLANFLRSVSLGLKSLAIKLEPRHYEYNSTDIAFPCLNELEVSATYDGAWPYGRPNAAFLEQLTTRLTFPKLKALRVTDCCLEGNTMVRLIVPTLKSLNLSCVKMEYWSDALGKLCFVLRENGTRLEELRIGRNVGGGQRYGDTQTSKFDFASLSEMKILDVPIGKNDYGVLEFLSSPAAKIEKFSMPSSMRYAKGQPLSQIFQGYHSLKSVRFWGWSLDDKTVRELGQVLLASGLDSQLATLDISQNSSVTLAGIEGLITEATQLAPSSIISDVKVSLKYLKYFKGRLCRTAVHM